MKHGSKNTVSRSRRGILILVALFSLCVSDSAGPRLLPLPNISANIVSSTQALSTGSPSSRTPTPGREKNTYIEMLSASQYRARDRYQDSQTASCSFQPSLQLQSALLSNAPPVYTSVSIKNPSLSVPIGRAPPRSI